MTAPQYDLPKKYLVRVSRLDQTTAWVNLGGMNNYTPRLDQVKQDGTTFDHGLYKGPQIVTQLGWGGAGTLLRPKTAGVEDAGQKIVRQAAVPATATGIPQIVGVQILDRFGGPDENVEGRASITWEPQGGGPTDLQSVNFTLDGDGFAAPIANPLASTILPAVATATPTGAAAGAQVTITGAAFTGATSVKFGATNASAFTVVSDSVIVAVVPAGTAGTANVTVITAAGTSNALSYTRGA